MSIAIHRTGANFFSCCYLVAVVAVLVILVVFVFRRRRFGLLLLLRWLCSLRSLTSRQDFNIELGDSSMSDLSQCLGRQAIAERQSVTPSGMSLAI